MSALLADLLGSPERRIGLALGAGAFLLLVLIGRPLVWWLYGFDRRIRALRSEQRSAEVRLGSIVESLAPLLEDFPVEIGRPGTSTVFLGEPIDYLHFDPDEGITFIEVKSGGSQLSTKQQRLREAVEEGRVRWATYRVR